MALTERTEIGSREVLVDGQIQVRADLIVYRDGVEIGRTYHRHVVVPGQDLTSEDESVRIVALAVHTPAVVTAYREARDAAR